MRRIAISEPRKCKKGGFSVKAKKFLSWFLPCCLVVLVALILAIIPEASAAIFAHKGLQSLVILVLLGALGIIIWQGAKNVPEG